MHARKCLFVLLAGLTLVGLSCAKKKESAPLDTSAYQDMPIPSDKDENGWPLYQNPFDGYAMALPPNWRRISLDQNMWTNVRKQQLDKKSPEIAFKNSLAGAASSTGVLFLGMESWPSAGDVHLGAPHNFKTAMTLDEYTQLHLKTMQSMGRHKSIQHQRVQTASKMPAARFQYLDAGMPGTGGDEYIVEFYYLKGPVVYNLTCTSRSGDKPKHDPIFDKIGKSFRFLRG